MGKSLSPFSLLHPIVYLAGRLARRADSRMGWSQDDMCVDRLPPTCIHMQGETRNGEGRPNHSTIARFHRRPRDNAMLVTEASWHAGLEVYRNLRCISREQFLQLSSRGEPKFAQQNEAANARKEKMCHFCFARQKRCLLPDKTVFESAATKNL